jgi:hypothetical protein
MSKKQVSANTEAPKNIAVEQEVASAPAPKIQKPVKPSWEFKDRTYFLIGRKQPIISTLPGKHTEKRNLLWFDPELGYQRELRYATNQKSPFVDEQEGPATLEHIVFRNGTITVPAQRQNLQKLLSLYHPLKGVMYEEFDAVQVAEWDISDIEIEIDALNLARELDIDMLEAIIRVDQGSAVKNMTSKEIKRDALIYAKRNPALFLQLAGDENVQLRNVGVRSVEQGFISLSQDQRTFTWTSTKRKLMTVPFDENPYSALAAWFKTDEGVEVFQSVSKRLK